MRAGAARPDRAVNDSLLLIDGRTAQVGTTDRTKCCGGDALHVPTVTEHIPSWEPLKEREALIADFDQHSGIVCCARGDCLRPNFTVDISSHKFLQHLCSPIDA
jgi:hypothetical protein